MHAVLWRVYSSRDAEAAAHAYCTLDQVRSVAPWVGEVWHDNGPDGKGGTRLLFPAECISQLEAEVSKLSIGVDGAVARGQPVNIVELVRAQGELERARLEKAARGNNKLD